MSSYRPWHRAAVCREIGDAPFFPAPYDRARRLDALAVCLTCPVWSACLDAALVEEDGAARDCRFGIRGATTPTQRWRMQQDPAEAERIRAELAERARRAVRFGYDVARAELAGARTDTAAA